MAASKAFRVDNHSYHPASFIYYNGVPSIQWERRTFIENDTATYTSGIIVRNRRCTRQDIVDAFDDLDDPDFM